MSSNRAYPLDTGRGQAAFRGWILHKGRAVIISMIIVAYLLALYAADLTHESSRLPRSSRSARST
jgi:hypothetical protein